MKIFKDDNNFMKEKVYTMKNLFSKNNSVSKLNTDLRKHIELIQQYRAVNFEDVCRVAQQICENIVETAIASGNWSETETIEKLISAGADDILTNTYSDGDYEIVCTFNYTPDGTYILSVPYSCQMTVSVSSDRTIDFMYGISAFTITRSGIKETVDTAILYSCFSSHPEQFDVNMFLDYLK